MEVIIAILMGIFIMGTGIFAIWQFNRDTASEKYRREGQKR